MKHSIYLTRWVYFAGVLCITPMYLNQTNMTITIRKQGSMLRCFYLYESTQDLFSMYIGGCVYKRFDIPWG